MAKTKVVHACNECGTPHPKWAGQCSACGAWNTLVEEIAAPSDTATAGTPFPSPAPVQIADIDTQVGRPQPTGISELDRVLGGGIVPGSVTLLGGEPGIGKSTLLLQLLAWWPASTLYVSAEESAQQVRLRAERLGAVRPDLWLVAATAMPDIVAAIDQVRPALVVVDSIQAVADPGLGSPPGSVMQVRACAHRLVVEAKRRGIPVVLVGHVTKEGGLAGPRVLEHVVDTVLSFEGDRHHALRLLRATKHRFGPTDELGLFEMASAGLVGVPDSSTLFLADRRTGVPGSAIAPTIEGKRPMVVEVQALTAAAPYDVPVRRTSQGIDSGRLALLLAVLQQRARQPVGNADVYVSTVGGVRLVEPGLDLAVCMAVVSALTGRPMPADLAVFGEVGLGGELRQVGHTRRRLSEAARLGFARVIVPGNSPNGVEGVRMVRVTTLSEALAAAGLVGEGARPAVGGGRAQQDPPMPVRYSGANEQMRNALSRVAPGTPLRDGIDRVVRAKAGALLVLSDERDVLAICSGGFLVDAPYSPQRLSELAKMDGAIIISTDGDRIARANVHLVPDPTVPTTETGTRHRTAERVARSLDVPVVSASEEMGVINVYAGGSRHQLQEIGRLLDRANQALQTLERYKIRLDDAIANLTAVEIEDVVTLRDVIIVVQRGEMVHRIADEIETMIIELGVDARLLRLQLDELYGEIDDELDLVVADYLPPGGDVLRTLEEMSRLTDDEVLDLRVAAATLHREGDYTDLDQELAPKGLRLLHRVHRLPHRTAAAITDHFGSLAKLQRVTIDDLMSVDGVDEATAQLVKETLERVTESTILDQYS